MKKSKAKEGPLDITPDSPLGRMLRFWGDSTKQRGKKMIKYCCFIWPKDPTQKLFIFWTKFGSDKGWVCQALVIYVNEKTLST
jgi:hypothetical protein